MDSKGTGSQKGPAILDGSRPKNRALIASFPRDLASLWTAEAEEQATFEGPPVLLSSDREARCLVWQETLFKAEQAAAGASAIPGA